jgi:hypothetical protein
VIAGPRTATAVGALAVVAALATSCGGSSKSGSKPASGGSSASTTPTTSSSGGSAKGGDASKGTLTVTGGDQFTGALDTSNSEVCKPTLAGSGQVELRLLYAGPNGTQREFDVNGATAGTKQVTQGMTTPNLSYSDYEEAGGGSASDYYDWGIGAQGGKGTNGTLMVTSPKEGSLTGDMTYAGDESRKYSSTYRQPIHIVASWKCP